LASTGICRSVRSIRVGLIVSAGTYEGQAEDVATAAVGNFLVTRADVSDETAYQMTKLMFEAAVGQQRVIAVEDARAAESLGKTGLAWIAGAERDQ
ncbi:hypothetical protein EN877_33890, partial [Mesorhizobium sp. M1D.F.Ca.ET.234.01.1.1]